MQSFPAGEPIQATHKELAKVLNATTRTVRNALEQLEETGYIRIVSGKEDGEKNTYFVNPPVEVLPAVIPETPPIIEKAFEPTDYVIKKKITYLEDSSGNITVLDTRKMLPTIHYKKPEWHTMPIQKLATELQHDLINNGAVDLIVANKGKENEITSYVLATCNEVDSIISLTEFDRQVQDAISSLWEHGHKDHIITPDIVARAMNHKTQTEYISPQYKGAVTKSIEKMRRIHIALDASEEIRKRKTILDGEKIDSFKVDDYLLSFKGIEIGAGGKTVKGYLIQSEPLLLTYAKMTGQIATVDARLLDIKKVSKNGKATTVSIVNTEPRTAVKGYLLRRIAVMNNDRTKKTHKQSNIILFDTLFEETGIPQDNNSANTKKYAFQVLDYFKAMNYIKGYTKRKNRKSFDAVIIDL